MKFFIDTANLDEIREAAAMGIISGVTTNPSLIAKEGKDYEETLREIAKIVDGPISGEVKASTTLARGYVHRRPYHLPDPSQYGGEDPHDGGRIESREDPVF